MSRSMIVGRQMIVGHRGHWGGGHERQRDYEELMDFQSGAGAPPPPPMMHPGPPPPPPPGHPGHPSHPMHPHHHIWRQSMQAGPWALPGPYGSQIRGLPAAYQRSPYGPHIVEEHPTHTREFPIGFVMFDLPGLGAQTGIEQKPQVVFRGERLAVPASIVGDFDIADIKVGKDSQLAAPGNMPSECFSNLSVGVRMELDTAEPGITITLFIQNNANEPQDFKSILYGTVLE